MIASYTSRAQASYSDDKIIVINDKTEAMTDTESYILGVLANEVPVNYDKETIKAMAVIIRSFVVGKLNNEAEDDVEYVMSEDIGLPYIDVEKLKDTLGKKVYEENIEKYENAVNETYGEVIMYNDELITPLYHYVSVGNTRDAEELFGNSITYLKPVESRRDVECEDYLQIKNYAKEDFYSNANITKIDSSGYVLEIEAGDDSMSGEEFARQEGLNSSCFYIEYSDDGVRIVTKGKGHGFGMSMFGADIMAKTGSSYEDILQYYYKDIEIVKMIN